MIIRDGHRQLLMVGLEIVGPERAVNWIHGKVPGNVGIGRFINHSKVMAVHISTVWCLVTALNIQMVRIVGLHCQLIIGETEPRSSIQ